MFKVGDKIVYPMLKMPIGEMDISIPADNMKDANIRFIISKEEGLEVLAILDDKPTEMNSNWTKRYRDNQEILKTGDIFEIAKMVRNLAILDSDKGLSTTEKKLLNRARRILASELVMAGSLEKEEAEKMIDESIGL